MSGQSVAIHCERLGVHPADIMPRAIAAAAVEVEADREVVPVASHEQVQLEKEKTAKRGFTATTGRSVHTECVRGLADTLKG